MSWPPDEAEAVFFPSCWSMKVFCCIALQLPIPSFACGFIYLFCISETWFVYLKFMSSAAN